jgi:hypothetical protein
MPAGTDGGVHAERRISGKIRIDLPATTAKPNALAPQTHPQPGRLPRPSSPRCEFCEKAERSLRPCDKCGVALCTTCLAIGRQCLCHLTPENDGKNAQAKRMKIHSKYPAQASSSSASGTPGAVQQTAPNSKLAAMRAIPSEIRHKELKQHFGPKGKGGKREAQAITINDIPPPPPEPGPAAETPTVRNPNSYQASEPFWGQPRREGLPSDIEMYVDASHLGAPRGGGGTPPPAPGFRHAPPGVRSSSWEELSAMRGGIFFVFRGLGRYTQFKGILGWLKKEEPLLEKLMRDAWCAPREIGPHFGVDGPPANQHRDLCEALRVFFQCEYYHQGMEEAVSFYRLG